MHGIDASGNMRSTASPAPRACGAAPGPNREHRGTQNRRVLRSHGQPGCFGVRIGQVRSWGALSALLVLGTACFSCTSSDTNPARDASLGEGDWTASTLETNSAPSPDVEVGWKASVSGCGGFPGEAETTRQAVGVGDDAITEAEVDCSELLEWTYDQVSSTVTFLHRNADLNCCASLSIMVKVTEQSGTVELAETDDAEEHCKCMCTYDFRAEVPNVQGTLNVTLTRWVSEWDGDTGPKTRWEGTIDLNAGSGTVVLEERTGEDGCSPS